MKWIISSLVLFILTACSVPTEAAPSGNLSSDEPGMDEPAGSVPLETPRAIGELQPATVRPVEIKPLPVQPNPVENVTPIPVGVPDSLLEAIKMDLIKRIGVEFVEFGVVNAQAVVWPDGSLGCPTPGMEYIQVLVEGMRIVIIADGVMYEYHSGQKGELKLCPMMEEELPLLTNPDDQSGSLPVTPVDQ